SGGIDLMLDGPQQEPAIAPRTWRLQVGILPLMVLVACCGVLLWVARTAWENRDLDHSMVQNSVRALQSRDATQRLSAARDLGHLGFSAHDAAVPALIVTLKDPDAGVRSAAAEGLVQVVSEPAEANAVLRALVAALQDRDPAVRIASADVLRALAT